MRRIPHIALATGLAGLLLGGTAMAQDRYNSPYDWGQTTWQERDPYGAGYDAGRQDERMNRDRDVNRQRHDRMAREVMREQRTAMEILDNARMQIRRGNSREAWVALGMAETRLLSRVVPRGRSGQAATGAAIGAIRDARQALVQNDNWRARMRTARAMDLVASGAIIGRNLSGDRLEPAGRAGVGLPFGRGDS